ITVTGGVTSVHAPVSQNYGAAPLNGSFWRSLNYDLAGRVDVKYDWEAQAMGRAIWYGRRPPE
ncbi:MAG: hypothetical protein Q8K82_15200, partial [Gemmatimonadaceae bacterium]|nr:hypothetical protein [Gemmatimonadaceae bacterium]